MKKTKIGLVIIGVLVLLAMGYGFYLTGGPGVQRLRLQDQRKAIFLSEVATEVVVAYKKNNKVPESLQEVSTLSTTPRPDNEFSLADVEYHSVKNEQFQLCMVFSTEKQGETRSLLSDPWQLQQASHGAGNQCFTLDARAAAQTIPPELHQIQKDTEPIDEGVTSKMSVPPTQAPRIEK